jgi:hypothetical protein
MPFKQGVEPCVVVDRRHLRKFRGVLLSSDYKPHTGLKYRRDGEVQAWIRPIGRGRQVHVQEVRGRGGEIEVYAHTEPATAVEHAFSAILDGASFSGGAKALLNDLRDKGCDL